MVIVMKPSATKNDIKNIEGILKSLAWTSIYPTGSERTIIGVIGDKRLLADTPWSYAGCGPSGANSRTLQTGEEKPLNPNQR